MLNGINPQLETKRLILRPMQATDIDALHLIFTDRKVMAAFDHEPFTREQMEDWLQRNLTHQNEFGHGLFSVILKETGALIGDCGLEQMEDQGAAELGYDFRSDFWNQGFATEAALAVRDYAFDVLRLPQLISLIRVGNLASKRVAEKAGMKLAEEFTRYDVQYWKYAIISSSRKGLNMVNLVPSKETQSHVQTHKQDYPNNSFRASPTGLCRSGRPESATGIEAHTHHSRRHSVCTGICQRASSEHRIGLPRIARRAIRESLARGPCRILARADRDAEHVEPDVSSTTASEYLEMQARL